MNKVYKVIWSRVRNCCVVVSEIVKKRSGGGSKLGRMKAAVIGMTLAVALAAGTMMPMSPASAADYTTPITGTVATDTEYATAGVTTTDGVYNFTSATTIDANTAIAGGIWRGAVSGAIVGAIPESGIRTISLNMNGNDLTINSEGDGTVVGIAAIGAGSTNYTTVEINDPGAIYITATTSTETDYDSGLFVNASGQILIHNSGDNTVTIRGVNTGIKTQNGITGESKIVIDGLVDILVDGAAGESEGINAVASSVEVGGGKIAAINDAWCALRAYGEFVTDNYGRIYVNVVKDSDGNAIGAGDSWAQIDGDVVTNGGMGTNGIIAMGLSTADSYWIGNYGQSKGYGVTATCNGIVNVWISNGAYWKGFGTGTMNVYIEGEDSYWLGYHAAEQTDGTYLTLSLSDGATWYNAITAEQTNSSGEVVNADVYSLTSDGGVIDMTGANAFVGTVEALTSTASDGRATSITEYTNAETGGIDIASYSGDVTVIYRHDEETPTTIIGGDITITSAAEGSEITLLTDNTGLNTSSADYNDILLVNETLDALAHKLWYSGYVDGERNLTGYVTIAEGLTSVSATIKTGDITFLDTTGQGSYVYDKESSIAIDGSSTSKTFYQSIGAWESGDVYSFDEGYILNATNGNAVETGEDAGSLTEITIGDEISVAFNGAEAAAGILAYDGKDVTVSGDSAVLTVTGGTGISASGTGSDVIVSAPITIEAGTGVLASDGGSVTLTGDADMTSVTGASATNGGIIVLSGMTTISPQGTGTTTALSSDGTGSSVTIGDGTITGNVSASDGGAIEMNGTALSGNVSASGGGTIEMNDTTFTSGTLTSTGEGSKITATGLTYPSSSVNHAITASDGGEVIIDGNADSPSASMTGTMTISNGGSVTISDIRSINGGANTKVDNGSLTFDNVTYIYKAIEATNGSTVTLRNDSWISSNVTMTDSVLVVDDSILSSTNRFYNSTATISGGRGTSSQGSMYAYTGSKVTIAEVNGTGSLTADGSGSTITVKDSGYTGAATVTNGGEIVISNMSGNTSGVGVNGNLTATSGKITVTNASVGASASSKVTSSAAGEIIINLDDGYKWQGYADGAGTITATLSGSSTYWTGYSTNTNMTLNLSGATWNNSGASTISSLNSTNGIINMNSSSSSATIDNYSGSSYVYYSHDDDDPTTITGGDIKITNAGSGSSIYLVTDNTGLNTDTTTATNTEKYLLYGTLDSLANKLWYYGYADGETNLTGYVTIAEGLTSVSASLFTGNISYYGTGQGYYAYDMSGLVSIIDGSDSSKTFYGEQYTSETSEDLYTFTEDTVVADDGSGSYVTAVETGATAAGMTKIDAGKNTLYLYGDEYGIKAYNSKDVSVSAGKTVISAGTGISAAEGSSVEFAGETVINADTAISAAGDRTSVTLAEGTVTGAVNVLNSAKLILNGTTIGTSTTDAATTIDGASIKTTDGTKIVSNITLQNNSTGSFAGSTISGASTITNSDVDYNNSTISGASTITNSDVDYNNSTVSGQITLTNSTADLNGGSFGTVNAVSGSTMNVDSVTSGTFKYGSSGKYDGSTTSSGTIKNSTVSSLSAYDGSEVTVTDSTVNMIYGYGKNTNDEEYTGITVNGGTVRYVYSYLNGIINVNNLTGTGSSAIQTVGSNAGGGVITVTCSDVGRTTLANSVQNRYDSEINLIFGDGNTWQGYASGTGTINATLNSGSTWTGYSNGTTGMTLNLAEGAAWTNIGPSTLKSLNSKGGEITITNSSGSFGTTYIGSLTVTNYSGDSTVYYTNSADDSTSITGGDITITTAAEGSSISLVLTDSSGLDTSAMDADGIIAVYQTLNALANKLWYLGYADGEENLTAYATIAEGLTTASVTTVMTTAAVTYTGSGSVTEEISYKSTGQGYIGYDSMAIDGSDESKDTYTNNGVYDTENSGETEDIYDYSDVESPEVYAADAILTGEGAADKTTITAEGKTYNINASSTEGTGVSAYDGKTVEITASAVNISAYDGISADSGTVIINADTTTVSGDGSSIAADNSSSVTVNGDLAAETTITAENESEIAVTGSASTTDVTAQYSSMVTFGTEEAGTTLTAGTLTANDNSKIIVYGDAETSDLTAVGSSTIEINGAATVGDVSATENSTVYIEETESIGNIYVNSVSSVTADMVNDGTETKTVYVDGESSWTGDSAGTGTTQISVVSDSTWTGASTNEDTEVTLSGTWYNTGDSTVASLTAETDTSSEETVYAVLDQTTDGAGSVSVASYSGDMSAVYSHNSDGQTTEDYNGGALTITMATSGSTITLITDSSGVDLSTETAIAKTLDALAGKLYYTGWLDGESNLSATAQISEGLTNPSATVTVTYNDTTGQGEYLDGSLSTDDGSDTGTDTGDTGTDTGDTGTDTNTGGTIIYGDDETGMMRGAKSAMASAMLMWRDQQENLTRRLGDIRNGASSGTWARFYGGKTGYKTNNTYFNNEYWGVQIGADKLLENGWLVGLSLDYADGDSDYENGGSGSPKSYSLGVYATKQLGKGQYIDIAVRGSKLENDYRIYNDYGYWLDGDYKTHGLSASVECGKRIEINTDKGFYVEPQAQLTVSRLSSKNYSGVSDYGSGKLMNIHQKSMTSILGRIGIAAGVIREKGSAYIRADLYREFDGDTSSTFSAENEPTSRVDQDYSDTWAELNIGGNWKLSNSAFAFGEVSRRFGADYEAQWRANLGVRFLIGRDAKKTSSAPDQK